jgi:hypothetical protein
VIIVWQGRGYLVPITVAIFGTTFTAVGNAALGAGYCDKHQWPFGASIVLSAIATWLLAKFFMSRPRPITITQPTGKQIVVMGTNDRLFFIPMQYWAPILVTVGILVCLIDLVP